MAENNAAVPAAQATVAAPRATSGLGVESRQQTLVPTAAEQQSQQTLLPTAAPVPAAQATSGLGVESQQQTLLPTVAEEQLQQTLLPAVPAEQPQQTLLPTVAEQQPQQTLLPTVGLSDDDDSAAAGFDFIENEQNLAMPPLTADSISENEPISSLQAMGRWLRQAADWRTYWGAAESLGEQAAEYKFAYDEGKLGDFEAKSFAKETLKAGVRSLGADSLRAAGNVFAMFGANLENRGAVSTIATAGAGLALPEAGKIMQTIGGKLGEFAEKLENAPLLAPAEAADDNDPNWLKIANVLGQGSGQVLAMGGLARFIGAAPAYGLFAGGGAGEVFRESYAKDGDADTATTLALLSGGTTFAIDRLFSPLPKQISGEARTTAKMIAREMAGAPLREAGSEVLQQLLAENLVRQVGIDETQDLFEGLIESALGAVAGASALNTASGGIYLARKTYEDARLRILRRGVSAEELALYEKNMLAFIQSKPEAFGKVLSYNLQRNLDKMGEAARSLGEAAERRKQQNALKEFKRIYDEMYARSFKATGDENKAKIAAGLVQANAMALYQADKTFSPAAIRAAGLPQVRQENYRDFQQNRQPSGAVLYQFGGTRARFADFAKLKEARLLEVGRINPKSIWNRTGWYHGSDGLWRFEISDAGAKLKVLNSVSADELPKRYWNDYITRLETLEAQEILHLRELEGWTIQGKPIVKEYYNYIYNDFIEFLDKHYKRRFTTGVTRSGLFTYVDHEAELEGKVKANRELVDSKVEALAIGYERQLKEQRERQNWSRMPAYLRDLSLRELLIERQKFVAPDEDGAELGVPANDVAAAADTKNSSDINIGGESGATSSARPVRLLLQGSDTDKSALPRFVAKIGDDPENVKREKEKFYKNFSRHDFLDDDNSEVLAKINRTDYKIDVDQDGFIQKMEEMLKSYVHKEYFNPFLGVWIKMRPSSANKYIRFWGDDRKKMLIPYLPKLLHDAKFTVRQVPYDVLAEPNTRAYYKAYFPVLVDGERTNSRMTIKEDNNGNFFWDLRLEEASDAEVSQTKEEAAKQSASGGRPRWRRHKAANSNVPSIDYRYTDEQLKTAHAVFDENKYRQFLKDVKPVDDEYDDNVKRVVKHIVEEEGDLPGAYLHNYEVKQEMVPRYKKRRAAVRQMKLHNEPAFYEDLKREELYRMYLAGEGDFHKPYPNMAYRPEFYREAHLPELMSDKFFSQPQFRYLLPKEKADMAEKLDKIYRIYRMHREAEFAREAERRDVQAANAYIAEHAGEDESLRRYWLERQLLLERKEVKFGELLDHPELYRHYPDLQDITVRFAELDNNDGYHFYHDKNADADVLEIDPRQFDYANLKELLLSGASFAIQMREGFDVGLSPSQQRNFMDRHIYLAKKEISPMTGQMLSKFLQRHLPGEKRSDYLIEKEMPLPLLHLYQSEAVRKNGADMLNNEAEEERVTYREIDYDKLYAKMEERYGSRWLDPDERVLGNMAYAALQNLREDLNAEILMRARHFSGYKTAAPFPWSGLRAQGTLDTRAMLRRQEYTDWQRSFPYWDEYNKMPPADRRFLSYGDLDKLNGAEAVGYFTEPDTMSAVPEDTVGPTTKKARQQRIIDVLAKGAYDTAERTIYLFENADAETIVHETFHYLSNLLRGVELNIAPEIKRAYQELMDVYLQRILGFYYPVERNGKYHLRYRAINNIMPDIPGWYDSPGEAVAAASEELFVQAFLDALNGKPFWSGTHEMKIRDFYILWLQQITERLGVSEENRRKVLKE